MGVSLASVADDRHLACGYGGGIGIVVIEDCSHVYLPGIADRSGIVTGRRRNVIPPL